jgi:hypothetical protein
MPACTDRPAVSPTSRRADQRPPGHGYRARGPLLRARHRVDPVRGA